MLQQKYKVKHIKSRAKPPRSAKGILGKLYLDSQSLKILLFTLRALPTIYKNKSQILIPLNGGWQVAILRVFSKLIGSKILISGHAGIGHDDAWNLFFRPDVFVALTKAEELWAKKLVPEVATVVIPNGVDLSRFNPKVKAEEVPLPKPIVVCASALVPYKRVDLTIRAVAKNKNLSLLVLGDGELKGVTDTLGKRLLGSRYLRKCVPYKKMPGYYRAGSVFSLASTTEAFGIAYVEAMACNLPVVTTHDWSRAEIIGDTGILTNPQDLRQYAKDLEITSRTKYGNRPYAQALSFSWNNVATKYSHLIEKMTAKQ
jgi:glycosyltransferase involved in cell wall biosynthesis